MKRTSCKSVTKLDNGLIRKQYDLSMPRHRQRFAREVAVLERTNGCPFVPQLTAVNRSKGELTMTDCGTSLDRLPTAERDEYKRQLPAAMRELAAKWGVTRVCRSRLHRKRTVPSRNATVKDGRVAIIDFNGTRWRIDGQPVDPSSKAANHHRHRDS